MPALTIDIGKIEHNTKTMVEMCSKQGINVAAVTKCYCGMAEIAEASIRGGAYMLADSRLENLVKLKHLKIPKLLLRLPMLSEIDDVIEYADISFNSEYKTMKALSLKALEKNKRHKIIFMVDLGDLREGVWSTDAVSYVEDIIKLEGIELMGIGTNLTCFGGVLPSVDNLSLLGNIAKQIESTYHIKLEVVTGGNSSSVYLIEDGQIPNKINQLRFGEAILFGTEFAYGQRIKNTYNDVFKLYAEIVELKEKQSIPIGEIGLDAFGQKPVFIDKGIRKRAILGIGKQDVRIESIMPIDNEIVVLGASSDHLIVDVTESEREYDVGDIIEFNVLYPAVLSLMTSEYVDKIIIK